MKKLSWYWAFRNVILGPFLRLWNRPTARGLENIPAAGAALIASNHQSVFDSFYLPLLCPRQITFIAKKEYFTGTGLVGRFQKWFFTAVGQVPVDRDSAGAGQAAVATATRILQEGRLMGIYPEGTRSPDGRLYRAKTGGARIALETGVPVIPVAMIGTREANPIGSWFIRPVKVSMIVGEPIDPIAVVKAAGLDADPTSWEASRFLADYLTEAIQRLSGQVYVDCYAADVKKSLAAGDGYPEGAGPTDGRPAPAA